MNRRDVTDGQTTMQTDGRDATLNAGSYMGGSTTNSKMRRRISNPHETIGFRQSFKFIQLKYYLLA